MTFPKKTFKLYFSISKTIEMTMYFVIPFKKTFNMRINPYGCNDEVIEMSLTWVKAI